MLTVPHAGRVGKGSPLQTSLKLRRWFATCLAAAISLSAVNRSFAQTTSASSNGIATALANERAANEPIKPDDGQWPIPGRNYGATRYAAIDQINTQNVKDLKVAWTFSTGVNRGQEAP